MPDETSSVVTESEQVLKLSKKDAQRLAEMTAQLVASSAEKSEPVVDPTQRPTFTPPEAKSEDEGDRLPRKLKGLVPGGTKGNTEIAEAVAKAFSINKFPRDMDAKDFSMSRWMMAVERKKELGESVDKNAPREQAYYEALASYGKEFKALGEYVSGQDGGFLAPEIWTNTFYDMLYPAQIMSKLPITRMQMGGRVQHIPKLVSQVAIGYSAESAALSPSNPQFAQLSFTARKQYAFIQIPNELIRDSAPAADQLIFNHAQTRMAVDRDTQILIGNGQSGAPVGLLNATNVGSYTIAADAGNGGTPAYSDFVALPNLVRTLNNSANVPVGQTDCTGVVGAVRVEQTIANLKDTNGRPLWQYGAGQIGRVPSPGWLGVPNWVLSNIVPTNVTKGSSNVTSYLFAGDWQYLILMQRQDVEFLSTNVGGTAFQNDQTWARLISRYDVGVIHPEAFTVANGVLL